MEYPLASPLPTTAPHPRDVGLKLLKARQGFVQTCGFVDAIFRSSITCPLGSICAQNTAVNALYCCNSLIFPYCGIGPTSCVDSTDYAVSCTGICPFDSNVVKCTDGVFTLCGQTKYGYSTLAHSLTGYGCNSVAGFATAHDYYSNNGGISYAAATPSVANGLSASLTDSAVVSSTNVNPILAGGGGATHSPSGDSSGTGSGASTGTNTSNSSSSSSSGLSTGAIVGIAIGGLAGLAVIIGLIALLCLQRRRHDRQRKRINPIQNPYVVPPPNPNMVQVPPPMPISPPPTTHHTSMASGSQTSSTPLTQANIAAISQPSHQSEVSPNESASQVGGLYQGSVLSHSSPPNIGGGSNAASQEHSGLGPLAGPHYATGDTAFPHANNNPSVVSPGSVFGSIAPVPAPSAAASYRPPG